MWAISALGNAPISVGHTPSPQPSPQPMCAKLSGIVELAARMLIPGSLDKTEPDLVNGVDDVFDQLNLL